MTETDPCVGLELDRWLGCGRELATPCDTLRSLWDIGSAKGSDKVKRSSGLKTSDMFVTLFVANFVAMYSLWKWVHGLAREEASDGPWTV